MPKKRTAFVYFVMEHRKTLPEQVAKEQSKVSESAGKAWGEMSEAAKAPYNALAEADKARYEEELAAYEAKKRAERKSLGAGGWCWSAAGQYLAAYMWAHSHGLWRSEAWGCEAGLRADFWAVWWRVASCSGALCIAPDAVIRSHAAGL